MNQPAINFNERFNDFYEQGYFNIEDGLPFQNSQEFFDVLYTEMFMNREISRLPIIATNEGIFIQTQPSSMDELNHKSLLEMIGASPKDITFASGIEEMSLNNKPTSTPYISVPFTNVFTGNKATAYWVLKNGSDTYGKVLTADGLDKLRRIFEKIEGVTFVN